MEIDDTLYKAFLVELEALERFRIAYTGLHPGAPLQREDPDVRRLIEAMAMFTARTHLASQRSIARGTMRVFRQHFPFLLNPVPAAAMLAAQIDRRFTDAAEVPRGTLVALSSDDTEASTLEFRTLSPLRLLPIELDRVDLLKLGNRGYRLFLRFESDFPRKDDIGELNLYVNHLNDFVSSLTVHYHLKKSLTRVHAFFGKFDPESELGAPCTARFGAPRSPPSQLEAFEHPLERARQVLRFPQQELYINVNVPRPVSNWSELTLCFDLTAAWPAQLRPSADTFSIHTAPIINVVRDMSTPFECDGTKERYSIQHPAPGREFRVHSVIGAYRLDGEGLIPLLPGAIAGGEDTYEVEHEGYGEKRKSWVYLNLPRAFKDPVRVAIEAFWHQPVFNRDDAPEYRASLADRHLEGVRWECLGNVVAGTDNPLADVQEGLLHLLSIKSQRFLDLAEVQFLLEAMGISAERHFRDVVRLLAKVELRQKPFAKSSTGFKYIYRVTFSELHSSMLPLLDLFAAKLLLILKAWSTEDVVELEVAVPNLEKTFLFTDAPEQI